MWYIAKEHGMLNTLTHLSCFHPKFLSLDETLNGHLNSEADISALYAWFCHGGSYLSVIVKNNKLEVEEKS